MRDDVIEKLKANWLTEAMVTDLIHSLSGSKPDLEHWIAWIEHNQAPFARDNRKVTAKAKTIRWRDSSKGFPSQVASSRNDLLSAKRQLQASQAALEQAQAAVASAQAQVEACEAEQVTVLQTQLAAAVERQIRDVVVLGPAFQLMRIISPLQPRSRQSTEQLSMSRPRTKEELARQRESRFLQRAIDALGGNEHFDEEIRRALMDICLRHWEAGDAALRDPEDLRHSIRGYKLTDAEAMMQAYQQLEEENSETPAHPFQGDAALALDQIEPHMDDWCASVESGKIDENLAPLVLLVIAEILDKARPTTNGHSRKSRLMRK
ncbi:hypothetical protein [Sphingomonas sp. PR090111-T3T-6A]|uniref:hypothetical protein n=1 Tax=Sphingomonas sp. PR090111-T3T-6A TaxID=685778 RepID=UPI0012FA6E05|nr:hypothetical protein [Sphingomonas sp. PR090111-T3T-6A]